MILLDRNCETSARKVWHYKGSNLTCFDFINPSHFFQTTMDDDCSNGFEFHGLDEHVWGGKSRIDGMSWLDADMKTDIDIGDLFNLKTLQLQIGVHDGNAVDVSGSTTSNVAYSNMGIVQNSVTAEGSCGNIYFDTQFSLTPGNTFVGSRCTRKFDGRVDKGMFEEMISELSDEAISKGIYLEPLELNSKLVKAESFLNTNDHGNETSIVSDDYINNTGDTIENTVSSINSRQHVNDDFDLLARKGSASFKLLTPQELESLPSRTLGFDDASLKYDGKKEVLNSTDVSFNYSPFDSQDLSTSSIFSQELISTDQDQDYIENSNINLSKSSVDGNLFNGNIDGNVCDASEILASTAIIPENGKEDDCCSNESIKLCQKNASEALCSVDLNQNSDCSKLNLCLSRVGRQLSSGNINKKCEETESRHAWKTSCNNIGRNFKSNNQSQDQEQCLKYNMKYIDKETEHSTTIASCNISSLNPKTDKGINVDYTADNHKGIATVKMNINSKDNFTIITIISSNNEQTVFKVNGSSVNAVLSIKESSLFPLGLTKQQFHSLALIAEKVIQQLTLQNKESNNKNGMNIKENFEINHLMKELHPPVNILKSQLQSTEQLNLCHTTVQESKNAKVPLIYDSLTYMKQPLSAKDNCSVVKHSGVNSQKFELESKYGLSRKKKIAHSNENKGRKVRTGNEKEVSIRSSGLPTMVAMPSVLDSLSVSSLLKDRGEFTSSDNTDEQETDDSNTVGDKTSDDIINKALEGIGITMPVMIASQKLVKGKKLWTCVHPTCGKHFPKINLLKVHLLSHKGIRPFKCTYDGCDWSFYTAYKLKRHIETHLGRRDFACDKAGCGKSFTTIYNLNTHKRQHLQASPWSCAVKTCPLSFHSRRELEMHVKTHTDLDAPYKCDVEGCNKAYFRPNALASHLRSHNKLEDLTCRWEGCGKTFTKPCRFKAHMLVHLGDKPYICKYEGCSWAFYTASKLRRHERKHTNERKFLCLLCKKSFLRSEHLRGHLHTHTGARNFQCPLGNCDAKFSAKSSLYVHMKKHNVKNGPKVTYCCPVELCSRYFGSKISFRNHLEKKHSLAMSALSQLECASLSTDNLSPLGLSSDSSHIDSLVIDIGPSIVRTELDLGDLNCVSKLPGLTEKGDEDLSLNFSKPDHGTALVARKPKKKPTASKKIIGSELTGNFGNDGCLDASLDSLTVSSHLQATLLQDDGSVTSDLYYHDSLICNDILSDSTSDPQSTINLRDLE